MDNIKIIASGSKSNAVLYFDRVLVDCGVTYNKIEKYLEGIEVILISHLHKDHYNPTTIKRIGLEYPQIKVYNPALLFEKGIDDTGRMYKTLINDGNVTTVRLYHDVPCFGFAIGINGKKIFHATDTAHLDGINAKDFDYYCLETNYDETVIDIIANSEHENGIYSHAEGSKNSHLSLQQALDFFEKNKKPSSQFVGLHKSETYF